MKPECTALSTVGFIPLSRGMLAFVDANDLPLLAGRKWNASLCKHGHAYASDSKMKRMHRVLLRASKGQFVDHFNGMGLDNRRSNIRIVTHKENMRNSVKRCLHTASNFKGLWRRAASRGPASNARPWAACIRVNGRTIHLGYYASEEEAAKAYDQAARQHHGKFARLNFPDEALQA